MQTVKSAIEEFKQSDEIQRLSKSSRSRHRLVLDLLRDEAGPSTPAARITRAHIDGVLADRRANGCTEATINVYKTSLRQLGAWLFDVGYTKKNPATHLRNAKTSTPRSKRKPVSADQVRQMLKLADVRHPRDAMTLMLLIYTGCRASEIVGLRWRDVDFDTRTISVYRGKQRSWFSPPMPVELYDALKAWLDHPLCADVKPEDYVVPALRRRGFQYGHVPYAMSPEWPLASDRPQTGMRGRVKALMLAVGETDVKGRGAHTMRRTAANLLLSATGDIRAAQALLGHSSVLMTELYLDIDAQQARYGQVIREWKI